MDYFPLVSVPVVTYNSADTVIETLDSIAAQTYQNIELIISDDCSTDNTIELCRKWINEHRNRFVRAELLTVENNTGVSANNNRANARCTGEWIKGIAGDDLMLPRCIEIFVNYVQEHRDAIFVFSKTHCFGANERIVKWMEDTYTYDFFTWSPDKQLTFLETRRNPIPANAVFFNREGFVNTGVTHDLRIPLLEDWPKWINLLKAGVKFHFIDEYTVNYRISENSLTTSEHISPRYQRAQALMFIYYQFKPIYQSGERIYALQRYIQAKRHLTNAWYWKILNRVSKMLFGVVTPKWE
jgi:alpha-1,3-rhamnosyltransferase